MPLWKTQMALAERSEWVSVNKGREGPRRNCDLGSRSRWVLVVRGKKACSLKKFDESKQKVYQGLRPIHKCGAPVLGLLTAHWRNRQVSSLTTQPRPWREALQSPRAQNSTWSFDQEVTFVLLVHQTLREPLEQQGGREGRITSLNHPFVSHF